MSTASRCDCGAALRDDLDWCPRCYTPRAQGETGESRPDPVPAERRPERPVSPIAARRSASTRGRWDATDVTFALPGRIIATIVFTLPMLWFLRFLVPFGFVGIVTYGVVYPRALREIWTRADRL